MERPILQLDGDHRSVFAIHLHDSVLLNRCFSLSLPTAPLQRLACFVYRVVLIVAASPTIIGQLRWLRLALRLMAQYFKPAKSTLLFLGRIKESVVAFNCHAFMSVKRYGHADLRLFGRVAG